MPSFLFLTIIFSILFFIGFLAIIFFFVKKKRTVLKKQNLAELYPKNSTFEHKSLPDNIESFQQQMKKYQINKRLKACEIKHIYLVHGTFVGDDPWNIFQLIELKFPKIKGSIIKSFKSLTKKGQDLFSRDIGNFTKKHVSLLQEECDGLKTVHNFSWSSGNNHLARVIGAFDLLKSIKENANTEDRILFLGHSHAGQLFSLITIFLKNRDIALYFINSISPVYDTSGIDNDFFKFFEHLQFEFVTMGTPPRYLWEELPNVNVTHVINHRGKLPIGGDLLGSLNTLNGDYIQQWGINGSDILPPDETQKEIIQKLDLYLGKGSDLSTFQTNFESRKRLHNRGHHILLDFKDNGTVPNFIQTIFGHGAYTKIKYIPFVLNLTIKKTALR